MFHNMLYGDCRRDTETLNGLFSFLEKSGGVQYFRKLVVKLLKKDLESSARPVHVVCRMMGLMNGAAEDMGVFNQGLRNAYDLVLREASFVNENS